MENCGTIWSHKWMRIETIIGDPKQVKIKCVNCGAEVVHNLVTNEVK
ncbi:hypothetical protein Bfsp1_2 [Cytobacillus phage Bfsp1]|nr:hypothetical protein Bfsp1_2 [Cytobacillus phage Bfsp1]